MLPYVLKIGTAVWGLALTASLQIAIGWQMVSCPKKEKKKSFKYSPSYTGMKQKKKGS